MGDERPKLVLADQKSCSACNFGYLGANGCYCIAFAELILDEHIAAADCPLWEPQ